jgi:D-lactate dehydrogenase (cytochrome)
MADGAATMAGDVLGALRRAVGAEAVLTEEALRIRMGMDVYRAGDPPVAVFRPGTVDALAIGVRVLAEAGVAILPRGGGASYTDGYILSGRPAVLIDTGALNRIEIDEENAIVVAEAGVTWAALREALLAKGWRTPFWGPFSGVAATVGGTMSQNGISHGTGAHGVSAASALSFDVVLASGELFATGGAGARGGRTVLRTFGPDLTGLFTGDCGALGVQARVVLPLLRRKPAFATVSWAFPNFASLHAGMRAAAIEALDDEHFAMDAALSQGQIARQERIAGAKAEIAAKVLRGKGLAAGLAQLAKMGVSGDRALRQSEYMCHWILEGVDEAEAKARAKRLRAILSEYGSEAPNTVPEVVRQMPFAPLINTLGPQGERWVPLHGVLAHSDALAFHVAYDELLERHAPDMERLGVWVGGMFETVGPSAFLYEVAMYWPGVPTAYHEAAIDADYLAKLPRHAPSPAADALVVALRREIVALYRRFEAGHFQIGRTYPYTERLSPAGLRLVRALKAELDPKGVMNPGVLGL